MRNPNMSLDHCVCNKTKTLGQEKVLVQPLLSFHSLVLTIDSASLFHYFTYVMIKFQNSVTYFKHVYELI